MSDVITNFGSKEGTIQTGAVTAAKLASNAVTATKIATGAVSTAKLADSGVTPAKIDNTSLVFTGFTGKNGAGACTLTGAKVGDVLGVVSITDGGNAAANFETTITVADQIQQSSASDLSTKKFSTLLLKKGRVTFDDPNECAHHSQLEWWAPEAIMSILLTTLVAELQGKVAARNSIPSSTQYAKAIKDAVADFSRRCSREKISTLNIVSGTASYDLPADFVRMIGMYDPASIEGVYVTPGGLIPTNGIGLPYERFTFSNGRLTITPTPAYSMTRSLRYAAGWALSTDTYADMTEAEAAIVMIKAEAECLTLQLNSEGSGVLSYRIGDESFDKSGGVQSMTGQRDARRAEYLDACESYNGAITLYGGLCQ